MKQHILVVDDEQDLCEILRYNLTAEGYMVDTANSAVEALALINIAEQSPVSGINKYGGGESSQGYDLLLLDVMMPGISGFEMAKQLKGRLPIIFLTAKDTEDDMLKGFHLGADDYMSKPFSVRELKARVKAVLNRTSTPAVPKPDVPLTVRYKGLVLNTNIRSVKVDGVDVSFTKTEFSLLLLMLTEPQHVFSRKELIAKVWPSDVVVTNRTVDVNITRVRKKIGVYANNIITRQGFGYFFQG